MGLAYKSPFTENSTSGFGYLILDYLFNLQLKSGENDDHVLSSPPHKAIIIKSLSKKRKLNSKFLVT